MELTEYLKEIERFMQDYLAKTGCKTYVLGLSGGVDSSLVAALINNAVGTDKLVVIMMPIYSIDSDLSDAMKIVNHFNLKYYIFDASEIYDKEIEMFKNSNIELDRLSCANLKARIRMNILYAYAQKNNGLVVGTDNMDERYTGYFTKYGDGAADIYPIIYLTKGEVVKSALYYGVPKELANRIPSAGLYEGQTDENEMGIKYSDLDKYLLGEQIPQEIIDKIEKMHRISEHKRSPICAPIEFKR